ncbi:hypothetical protein AB7227_16960, partial [Escherichia coli]|uniref:hypothetical protein n=1 Tax=Escherichia coli TaxID=562 RepID=UPI001BC8A5B0
MRQENACKAMHLIDAWLFSVKTGGFSGNFTQTDVIAYFHERRSLNNFHRDRVITFEQIAE